MPNVNDIANIAEALEKQPVIVVEDRCVAVRNRNASCRKCVDACPFGALNIELNKVSFDSASCVGCGACVVACPTEALVAANAPDGTIAAAAAVSLANAGNGAVIACARISSKRLADPELYAEVPCLSRVDETVVLELAARGAEYVALVDGTCKTCKHRDCVSGIDETIEQARLALEASGGHCVVERRSSFPDEVLLEDATGRFGSTRRGFLSDAVGAARETTMAAAKATLESELGLKAETPSIGDRLRVNAGGSLPTISVPRHDRLMNAFDALGEPVGERLESRRFATVEIDVARCNSCGMCAVFCPTGALRRNPAEKMSDPLLYLEFSASECVNCRLCRDACWKEALSIEPGVAIEQLYDFEPRRFDLPQVTKRNPFGKF